MRIVLWQNCLSPHQLPYIVHLLDDERVDEVVIVAGEDIIGNRKDMGWSVEQYEGIERCKMLVHPDDKVVDELLSLRQEDSCHFFSGIRADAFVFKCLQMSMVYDLQRGIITERPNRYDFVHDKANAKPYWMHRLRFWLQDRKYARKIQYVFAMGEEAVGYYNSLGMKWKVFPFCYCTYSPAVAEQPDISDGDTVQYTFCGSLTIRKDPVTLVRSLKLLEDADRCKVQIIGDGPLHPVLEKEIASDQLGDKVQLLGTKPQKDIPAFMQQTDVFILPSLYDGWGAVVNEALQSGCYVIVTDACGASDLIRQDKRLGLVVAAGNEKELATCMEYANTHIADIRQTRQWRREWAEEHISGKVVAKYMVDCICGVHNPCAVAPWAM